MKTKFPISSLYYLYFFISIIFSEFTVRIFTIGFDTFPTFLILFALSLASIPSIVCGALSGKVRTIVSFTFSIVIALIMCVQLVYHGFCGSFMQVAQLAMGGDAINAFGGAMWLEILKSSLGIFLLFVPCIVLLILNKTKFFNKSKTSFSALLCEIAIFFLLHFTVVFCLPLAGKGMFTPYNIYHDTFILDKSVRHFGVLTSLRLDIKNLFFGKTGNLILIQSSVSSGGEQNVIDVDFEKLIKNEENEDLKDMHKYFSVSASTGKNKFTGYFEGYNVILICVESFTHHLIDKDLTPTLYKMANEGFVFTDYYNTVSDNTSNGEYALLTGLIPDTTLLGEGWKTFYNYNSLTKSKENFMPFVLGNQFAARDYNTYAVHNHTASYYGRNKTHPNLGYQFLAFGQGLEKVETYPTSDLSMMEQSLPIIIQKDNEGNTEPFHAYFLTFSGHMPYVFNEEHNDMTVKNEEFVKDLPYSTRLKAYIACQLELEFALDYTIDYLEKAGVLENTLFVITNDHYPYPLDAVNADGSLKYLSELAGKKLDNHLDKYRSGLIMWSASMEAPIVVDKPCCSLDVLPTLSNMLGFTYDSRLLAGKDIFADGEHIAILADRSFITDKIIFDAEKEDFSLREGVTELEDGYFERIQTEVQNRFTISNKILYNDYYSVIYK